MVLFSHQAHLSLWFAFPRFLNPAESDYGFSNPAGPTFDFEYLCSFISKFDYSLGGVSGIHMRSIDGKNQRLKISCYWLFQVDDKKFSITLNMYFGMRWTEGRLNTEVCTVHTVYCYQWCTYSVFLSVVYIQHTIISGVHAVYCYQWCTTYIQYTVISCVHTVYCWQ